MLRRIKFFVIFLLLVVCLIACENKENKSNSDEKIKNNKKKIEILEKLEDVPPIQNLYENYASLVILGLGDLASGNMPTTGLNEILILEVNKETQEIYMASVCKTTLFKRTNGEFSSINGVYSKEKETGVINSLNTNLDLYIQNFLTINFISLAEIVDYIGGIEVSINESESKEMNKYIENISQYVGKESQVVCPGENTLDGVQSVAYSYIRQNVGDDIARTERQRLVFRCIFEKMKELNNVEIEECVNTIFEHVETNYNASELYKIMQKMSEYEIIDGMTYPQEYEVKNIAGIGNVIIPNDLNENVKKLNEFLRPNVMHNNSAVINELDKEIEQIVGN